MKPPRRPWRAPSAALGATNEPVGDEGFVTSEKVSPPRAEKTQVRHYVRVYGTGWSCSCGTAGRAHGTRADDAGYAHIHALGLTAIAAHHADGNSGYISGAPR